MIYNAVGFIFLSFLAKTKWSIWWLGNIFVFLGASAVVILAYYSGGIYSALYPWIISIPILALLVVGRKSSIFWAALSFAIMVWMGVLANNGTQLPVEYNIELKALWFLSIVPGLLLIVFFMSLVFEHNQSTAVKGLEHSNSVLMEQKETILQQRQRLEHILEEKDYIIRVLAHDIRNPLNNISSLVNLMSIENEREQVEEYNKMILDASESAKYLVNRVLEMDASSEENIQLKLEKLDISVSLRKVITNLERQATAKQMAIKYINESGNTKILADSTYLQLIFENLLSNAIKFTEKGKRVEVHSKVANNKIEVKIIDEGPGVSHEEHDKLFKTFSKLSARPTAGESSTGLGLSLVKRYVELFEGNVFYEDVKGAGAVFVVQFPIVTNGA